MSRSHFVLAAVVAYLGIMALLAVSACPTDAFTHDVDQASRPASGAWREEAFTASDGTQYGYFGRRVAMSGSTLVVGAGWADAASTKGTGGAAYVYERDPGPLGSWMEVRKLVAPDAAPGDGFGWSVAVDVDIIAVGATGRIEAGTEQTTALHAVYLFGQWGFVKKLQGSDTVAGDQFGYSVSLAGSILWVGAPYATISGKAAQGAAYIFAKDQDGLGQWGQVKKLVAPDGSQYERFGASLSGIGDTVAVGAPRAYWGPVREGAAYIFARDSGGAGQWGGVRRLRTLDGGTNFGVSVSMSGSDLVVGAEGAYSSGSQTGAAYLFNQDQGGVSQWGQVRKLVGSNAPADGWLGNSVSMSGDTVVVGARNAGRAYVFGRDQDGPGQWGQVKQLAPGPWLFGYSVATSGNAIAVGSPASQIDNKEYQGAVYAYRQLWYCYLPVVLNLAD
jgi:hypothetical protein